MDGRWIPTVATRGIAMTEDFERPCAEWVTDLALGTLFASAFLLAVTLLLLGY